MPAASDACTWGDISIDDDSVRLLKSGTEEPFFSVSYENIENCTQFRNDIKIQLKKASPETLSKQNDQLFHTAPCEIKFTIPSSDSEGTATYASAKSMCGSIQSALSATREKSGSGELSSTLESTSPEILKMSKLVLSTPHGHFDMIVTASSLILLKEKKASNIDDTAQSRIEIPLSRIFCTFLLPYPLSRAITGQGSEKKFARKYFVLALSEPVYVGSTKHAYIVFAIDDGDTYTEESPLNVNVTTVDEITSIFNGKIDASEAIYSESNSCMTLLGAKIELLAKIIKGMCGKKILGQSSFHNASDPSDVVAPYIRCMHKSSTGNLYFLEKSFLFLHKPVVFVSYEDIHSCSIDRDSEYAKTCSVQFTLRDQHDTTAASKNKLKFASITVEEMDVVRSWLTSKGVSIVSQAPVADEMDIDSESSEYQDE